MKKWIEHPAAARVFGALLLSAVSMMQLFGCGNAVRGMDETGLILKEDGSLTAVVVEDFAEDYYDFDELMTQITEEVKAYNTRNGETLIRMTECNKEDERVRLVMEYTSGEDYAAFNQVDFSYDAKGTQVIVTEPLLVRTVKKITDVSEGVEIRSDKEAYVAEDAVFPAIISTEE